MESYTTTENSTRKKGLHGYFSPAEREREPMNIISFAFKTRFCIILLQTLSNGLIPDHAASDVFLSPQPNKVVSWPEWIIEVLLGGFARWDSQYFLHIATYGYSYEQILAFYPLFPCTVGLIARPIHWLLPIVSLYHLCLCVAIGLNVFFFVMAVDCLHELSFRLTGNKKWAQHVAILFCLNPASIFFTAPYSESLFAWLSFKVMLEASESTPSVVRTAIPLSLSLITRSNGFISLGFVVYFALRSYCMQHKKAKKFSREAVVRRTLQILGTALTSYGLMQIYFYYRFCFSNHEFAHDPAVTQMAVERGFLLAGNTTAAWCNYSIPLSYSYVQATYWNVGFLRYYQWKQIPNFIAACPILFLLLCHCFTYIKTHFWYSVHLGLFESKATTKITVFERQTFPFVIHGLFLSLFCIFFVHIQVATRLLCSASPLLYWICANSFKNATIDGFEHIRDIIFADQEGRRLILIYFVGYTIIGTILFSNFLPWT